MKIVQGRKGFHMYSVGTFIVICLHLVNCTSTQDQTCIENDGVECKSAETQETDGPDSGNGNSMGGFDFDDQVTPPHHKLSKIDGVRIGHVQKVQSQGRVLELHTTSVKPQIIEIPNFLSPEECQHFITEAHSLGLKESVTVMSTAARQTGITLMDLNEDRRLSINEMMLTLEDYYDMYLDEQDLLKMYETLNMDPNGDDYITPDELEKVQPEQITEYLVEFSAKNPIKRSRFSKQVWLFPDTSVDKTFREVQKRVIDVTQLSPAMIRRSDFQVVSYGVGGHYNAHHDSSALNEDPCCTRTLKKNCRICRFMTILFYLNDVKEGGGTAFPVAGNETLDEQTFRENHQLNLQRYCNSSGIAVKPELGKAIIWYNHHIDEGHGWVGKLDEYTWHGGCPVIRGEKWIANFWIKYTDKQKQIPKDEL